MGKYKKNTKIRSVFFLYFICIFFRIFLYFYIQKNTKKIQKKQMQLLKNTKYKKKYESTISKIQNTKKNQQD